MKAIYMGDNGIFVLRFCFHRSDIVPEDFFLYLEFVVIRLISENLLVDVV